MVANLRWFKGKKDASGKKNSEDGAVAKTEMVVAQIKDSGNKKNEVVLVERWIQQKNSEMGAKNEKRTVAAKNKTMVAKNLNRCSKKALPKMWILAKNVADSSKNKNRL